jgi:dolichyl-phosphate beta-glucosyltransferase
MTVSTSATGQSVGSGAAGAAGASGVTVYPAVTSGAGAGGPYVMSVLLPVYRYSHGIAQTFAAVREYAREHADVEFLFVNDGSPDDTGEKIVTMLDEEETPDNIRLVSYRTNGGKGHAIKTGVFHTHGQSIVFMDGDLAYSLDHLRPMREGLEKHDVVIGSRSLIRDEGGNKRSFLRWFMGEAFNRLMWLVTGIPYTDTQAGIKGFKRDAAFYIFSHQRLKGFAFDVELIFIARRKRYSIIEIPAHVSEDHNSKGSSMNLIVDPIKMFLDLARVRFNGLRGRYD